MSLPAFITSAFLVVGFYSFTLSEVVNVLFFWTSSLAGDCAPSPDWWRLLVVCCDFSSTRFSKGVDFGAIFEDFCVGWVISLVMFSLIMFSKLSRGNGSSG